MKIRVIYSDKEYWEDFDPEQIDEVVFTLFAYFNVFMKNGESFSADKIDATVR